MPLSKYDIEVDLENRAGTSHAFLVEMVGANKRVLDVGCDTGYLGEALAAFGNRVWGFEISEVSAAEARKRLVECKVGDLEATDLGELFEPASFDVVIFGDVLEHLRDPLSVLRSARRLVAPGGSVLISTPNIAHGDVRLALLKGRFQYNKLGILDETHTKFFTSDSLTKFAHDAGFVIAELRRTRAELFSTEIAVSADEFSPELVASLREDPEATTYQFVARLIPDDAGTSVTEQALRVDRLNAEIEALQRALAARSAELEASIQERARLTDLADELRTAHDEAVRQREDLRTELLRRQAERSSEPARLSRSLRRLADRLRK